MKTTEATGIPAGQLMEQFETEVPLKFGNIAEDMLDLAIARQQ